MDPSKIPHFKVIEDGIVVLGPDAIDSIQIPGVTILTAEHSQANHMKKTPTKINVEDFDIVLFEDQAEHNNWWLTNLPYNQDTGAFLDPVDYEFTLLIQQLAWDLETPIRQWTVRDCMNLVSSYAASERTSVENQKRTITVTPHTMLEESL